jgi:hypothetical protein
MEQIEEKERQGHMKILLTLALGIALLVGATGTAFAGQRFFEEGLALAPIDQPTPEEMAPIDKYMKAIQTWEKTGDLSALQRVDPEQVAWLCEQSIEEAPAPRIKRLIQAAKDKGQCAPVPEFRPAPAIERPAPRRWIDTLTREEKFLMALVLAWPMPTVIQAPAPSAPAVEAYRAPATPYSGTFTDTGLGGFYRDNRGNTGVINSTGPQTDFTLTGPGGRR